MWPYPGTSMPPWEPLGLRILLLLLATWSLGRHVQVYWPLMIMAKGCTRQSHASCKYLLLNIQFGYCCLDFRDGYQLPSTPAPRQPATWLLPATNASSTTAATKLDSSLLLSFRPVTSYPHKGLQHAGKFRGLSRQIYTCMAIAYTGPTTGPRTHLTRFGFCDHPVAPPQSCKSRIPPDKYSMRAPTYDCYRLRGVHPKP